MGDWLYFPDYMLLFLPEQDLMKTDPSDKKKEQQKNKPTEHYFHNVNCG